MRLFGRRLVLAGLFLAGSAAAARAQTTVNGNAIALRSSGAASGTDWILSENGYVGSYITLPAAGNVTIAVQAAGASGGGPSAHLNLVVGDAKAPFDVAAGFTTYQHTFSLPAGTHFVRTEYTNDFVSNAVPASSRNLTVRSLAVTGAPVANSNSDANALAAADTYISNFRRGPAHVALVGATPGESAHVKLKRSAFNWGANMHGTSTALLANAQYTNFFKSHFNAVVPSRAGKWNNNESTRDVVTSVTTGYVDAILDFAEANNMRARMHNLIWGDDSANEEQPAWAVTMLQNPTNMDSPSGKTNLDALRDEISERIDYYVGDGPGGLADLSQRYAEVDIYNESWHTGVNTPSSSANYWDRYGASGIGDFYDEAAAAAATSNSAAKLYVNEYNVLQNGNDAYGNWYRQHIEAIQNADGDPADGPVSGVGMQLYAVNGLSPAYMQQVLQNMSVTGLAHTITEFGVQSGVSGVTDPAVAKDYVNKSLRMAFGDPDMNTFMYWGFWGGNTSNLQGSSILANADWSLTEIGKMYEDMLGIQDWDGNPTNGWSTDVTLPVAADGTIDFTGFYGDFEITVGGKTYALTLSKGATGFQLVVNLSADFDNSGTVNAGDFTVWEQQFALGGSGGDADGDLDTDGDDFLVWQRQLGMSETAPLASAANHAVPEPGAIALAAWSVAAAVLGGLGRNRFHKPS